MKIKQKEDLLRRYLMEKGQYVSLYKNEKGFFNELKNVVKESLMKVFNLDIYPIDFALYTKEEALDHLKDIILYELSASKLEEISKDFDCEAFKKQVEAFFSSHRVDEIFSKKTWDFHSFSKLINPDGYDEKLDDRYNLRLICTVPVKNKYIVQGLYSKTIFFDCMMLEEKIKSIYIHYSPLTKKEKTELNNIYTSICVN